MIAVSPDRATRARAPAPDGRVAGLRLGSVASCSACGKELPGEFPFCPFCGAPIPGGRGASREQRKVVTVLFCDVTGSSALGEQLDPEALRALLARYFERMKSIVEKHGGLVEKFI